MISTIMISLSILFVIAGTLISLVTAIGMIRLKDIYSRGHAAGKSATLGAMFLLFGTFLYFIGTEKYINMQLIFGIIFIFITGPLSSHLIMRAAYNNKTPYTKDTKIDDLKDEFNNKKI